MIISGGVNIYPQEIEDALVMHPSVADVAVFGIPNEDFGEEVKAVVQPAPGVEPGPELAAELEAFARERLGRFKVPALHRLHGRAARDPAGEALQAQASRPLLGRQAHPHSVSQVRGRRVPPTRGEPCT